MCCRWTSLSVFTHDRVLTLSTNNNKNCIYNSFQWILLSPKCKSTKNDFVWMADAPKCDDNTKNEWAVSSHLNHQQTNTHTFTISFSLLWSIVLTEFNQFRLFLFNFWFSLHLSLSSVHTQRNTVGISFNSVSRFSTADNHITLSKHNNYERCVAAAHWQINCAIWVLERIKLFFYFFCVKFE